VVRIAPRRRATKPCWATPGRQRRRLLNPTARAARTTCRGGCAARSWAYPKRPCRSSPPRAGTASGFLIDRLPCCVFLGRGRRARLLAPSSSGGRGRWREPSMRATRLLAPLALATALVTPATARAAGQTLTYDGTRFSNSAEAFGAHRSAGRRSSRRGESPRPGRRPTPGSPGRTSSRRSGRARHSRLRARSRDAVEHNDPSIWTSGGVRSSFVLHRQVKVVAVR
jgi:hypothetical protein